MFCRNALNRFIERGMQKNIKHCFCREHPKTRVGFETTHRPKEEDLLFLESRLRCKCAAE